MVKILKARRTLKLESYSLLDKVDYSSAEKLTASLEKSIRAHKDHSKDKKSNSYYATLNSAIKTTLWYLLRG